MSDFITFKTNLFVKTFIISEIFLWSAWNFIMPVFAVFVADKLPGGNLEIAATGFSTYLIVRVVFELLSGKLLSGDGEKKKILVIIFGLVFISISHLGFMMTTQVFQIYLFYAVLGFGLGVSSPSKYSLFSVRLDKNRESAEWGAYDALTFIGMAGAASLGGFIATNYGFRSLFLISALVNSIAILPYIFYLMKLKKS